MIAVDASIAVKWFLPESLSAASANLFSLGRKLLAPDVLRHEVTAAIAKAARMDGIPAEEAQRQIAGWVRMLESHAISLIDSSVEFDEAVRLCLELRHPFHDCFYLAVAKRFGIPLATTDKCLIDQAQKIGVELFTIA